MMLSHRYDFTDLAPALPLFLSADASSNVWHLSSDRCILKWYPDEAHPEDIKWMPRHEKKMANFYSGLREPRLKKGRTPYSKRLRVDQTQYPTNISYFRFSRSWIQSSDCLNFRDPYTLQYTNLIRFELPEPSSLSVHQSALIFQDYTFPSFRYFLFKSVLFKPFLLNEERNALLLTGFSSQLQSSGFFASFKLNRLLFPFLRLSKHYSYTLAKQFISEKQKHLLSENPSTPFHINDLESLGNFAYKSKSKIIVRMMTCYDDPVERLVRDYFVRFSQIANDAFVSDKLFFLIDMQFWMNVLKI